MKRRTFDYERAAQMYAAGNRPMDIARALGVSAQSVNNARKAFALPAQHPKIVGDGRVWSDCPWCKVSIIGTTPAYPHVCGVANA